MNTARDEQYDYESSLVKRITRTYTAGMVVIIGVVLILFSYLNLSYLYTGTLVDVADRVTLQFENTLKQPSLENAFYASQTGYFQQQLDDLNKYSRPQNVRILVVFPNGVTGQYDEGLGRITFEVLPPEFFSVFRQAVKENDLTTEYPAISNQFARWTVAKPIRGAVGQSGGIVITSISINDVLRQLVPVFGIVGLILLLSFTFLAKAQKGFAEILQSPLNNITKALETWSLSGVKSGTNTTRKDEIGRLAKALDELALKLEEEQRCRDEDMKQRQNFFRDVSHELRTPVTSLRVQVELLRDGLATPEELPQYYEGIFRETLYIQKLVDDLLTLSRLQAAGFSMEKEPCCLLDILDDIYESMILVASEKGIRFSFQAEPLPEETIVLGNYSRLRQLTMIFVDNSIKYSRSGTDIRMALSAEGDDLLLSVEDEGCGIPAQDMDKVFKRQYRASNSGGAEGSGLGLQIAKEIAGLLGCTIVLDSEEDRGTTVTIRIPRLRES